MVDLLLSSLDVGTVRFATSRAHEIAMSLRALQHDATGLHRAWVRSTKERLAEHPEVDMAVLLALVPPSGFIADMLTPTLPVQPTSIRTEIDAIRGLDPLLLVADAVTLQDVAAGRGPEIDRALRDLLLAPGAGVRRVADAVEGYWEVALADRWPMIQRLLDADIATRSARLAQRGLRALIPELNPRVTMLPDRLRIEPAALDLGELPPGRGLVLNPSVFAAPRGVVGLSEPFVPTIVYHALGVGNLWAADEVDEEHALDDVVGRTRAQLLRAVGVPASTTELAGLLGLSGGTVSEHLAILRRAGLVDAARSGRAVLYRRTPVADALINQPPAGAPVAV